MLKSVIFLTTSDSLKEKCDKPPTTEYLILVRELKTELEDPHLVNMAQHHPYRNHTWGPANKMCRQLSQ